MATTPLAQFLDSIDTHINTITEGKILKEEDVCRLCDATKLILRKEKLIVEVRSPVNIVGDIHGQFDDLKKILTLTGEDIGNTNHVFLGDYINRGSQSLEVITLLFALKVKYPSNITLIRGNHESRGVSRMYGFYDELSNKYGSQLVWKEFCEVFDHFPISAVIDKRVFCPHGGLSPSLNSLDQLNTLERFQAVPSEGIVADLLWSDPSVSNGWNRSPRGTGYLFGKDISDEFLAKNGFESIVRGHQLAMQGYTWTHGVNVITVFSAPNYCNRCGNKGAIMRIDEKGEYEFIQYDPAPKIVAEEDPSADPAYFV